MKKKVLLTAVAAIALSAPIAGIAHSAVFCKVNGTHKLRAFPDGALRGKVGPGVVQVTAQGWGCNGGQYARVGRNWVEQKYLTDCDLSPLENIPYCE